MWLLVLPRNPDILHYEKVKKKFSYSTFLRLKTVSVFSLLEKEMYGAFPDGTAVLKEDRGFYLFTGY